jgi:hypothetical protein
VLPACGINCSTGMPHQNLGLPDHTCRYRCCIFAVTCKFLRLR